MNPQHWNSVLGEDGFSELVRSYGPRLIRFFESLGADNRLAEDLTQELYLKLLRTQAQYQERGQLQAYLFRMANRLWIDYARARKPYLLQEPTEEDLLRRHGPMTQPPVDCAAAESAQKLRDALATLPPSQRVVFEMGVVQGIRYRDIAQALEIPVGTVKTRVFAAASKLRALLAEELPNLTRLDGRR